MKLTKTQLLRTHKILFVAKATNKYVHFETGLAEGKEAHVAVMRNV